MSFNRQNPDAPSGFPPFDNSYLESDEVTEAELNERLKTSFIGVRPVFEVKLSSTRDNYPAISRAIAAAKRSKGTYGVYLKRPTNGDIANISNVLLFDFDDASLELDPGVSLKLTKTAYANLLGPDNNIGVCVIAFAGKLTGPNNERKYIKRPRLICRGGTAYVDANATATIATGGYVYDAFGNGTPGRHYGVDFVGTIDAYCEGVHSSNGLLGAFMLSYSPEIHIKRCHAFTPYYDNGIYVIGNREHIALYDDNNPNTWSNALIEDCNASFCMNHGLGSLGATGVTIRGGTIRYCGNNTGTNPAGPAGGLGVEYHNTNDPDNNRNYRFTAIGTKIYGSYGFGARTNCLGTRFLDLEIENTRVPTHAAYAALDPVPQVWGSAIFIQAKAADAEVRATIRGSERNGIRIQGGLKGNITASIADNILTVTNSGTVTLKIGDHIGGFGVAVGTKILSLGTGTGGVGTYILNIQKQTVASAALPVGSFPGGRFDVRISGCVRAIHALVVGSVRISSTSTFTNNGDVTNTDANPVVICSNSAGNVDGGQFECAGSFMNNYQQAINFGRLGRVALSDIKLHNNGSALASANHAIYSAGGNLGLLTAVNIVSTQTNAKTARILKTDSMGKAIINRKSIIGEQTSVGAPLADVVATTLIADPTTNDVWNTPAYASNFTPNPHSGHVNLGPLNVANTNINAPNGTGFTRGHRWTINFTSDAGARTIVWNAAWKGATLTVASAANQKASVTFEYDGVNFVQISSTGWYS